MNLKEILSRPQEGFTNGHSFDELKKGETVYVYYSANPSLEEYKLVEGKIVELVKAKNAKGHDRIRQVAVDIGNLHWMVSGPRYIKEQIFRKVENKQPSPAPMEGSDILYIERAMSPKNKEVQKYLNMGYAFKCKEWVSEKNMYVATLVKERQG
jgi:hypothetical protein